MTRPTVSTKAIIAMARLHREVLSRLPQRGQVSTKWLTGVVQTGQAFIGQVIRH